MLNFSRRRLKPELLPVSHLDLGGLEALLYRCEIHLLPRQPREGRPGLLGLLEAVARAVEAMEAKMADIKRSLRYLDGVLRQSTGSGLADLIRDSVNALLTNQGPKMGSTTPPQAGGDNPEWASRLLGVRSEADPEVIEAARRTLLRQVKGGEKVLGGDEERAKLINRAADILLKKG